MIAYPCRSVGFPQQRSPGRRRKHANDMITHQTTDFRAFTAKHFTTVRAGFALTLTSLPNTLRLPAFVAGLCLVFTMHTPGITNLPVPFTSFAATSARASNALFISALFVPQ